MAKEDYSSVLLEFAYYNENGVRISKSAYTTFQYAKNAIERYRSYSRCRMIYAKIRHISFIKDTCFIFNDKGELENEFYINPNKK